MLDNWVIISIYGNDIFANQSVIQWASSTANSWRLALTNGAEKRLHQGGEVAASGDMKTGAKQMENLEIFKGNKLSEK